jgi:hypothetical protein
LQAERARGLGPFQIGLIGCQVRAGLQPGVLFSVGKLFCYLDIRETDSLFPSRIDRAHNRLIEVAPGKFAPRDLDRQPVIAIGQCLGLLGASGLLIGGRHRSNIGQLLLHHTRLLVPERLLLGFTLCQPRPRRPLPRLPKTFSCTFIRQGGSIDAFELALGIRAVIGVDIKHPIQSP